MSNNQMISIQFLLIIIQIVLTSSTNWQYKFAYTKALNSQLTVDCGPENQIWVGWSHYGTRAISHASQSNSNMQLQSSTNSEQASIKLNEYFPNENDCWMNFTEKIAEQCNGADKCDLSSQPTYIHKCGKISDYLYVTYKCIKQLDTFDICQSSKKMFNHDQVAYIKSSEFPTEYEASLDCSCMISTANEKMPLKFEVLWFSLQDNDYLNVFNKNLSGWINPTYEMPITNNKVNTIRFLTDDALAYKGFWLKLSTRKACKDDWQLVGDTCVKVFSEQLDWRSANQHCQQMNGNLVKIDDVTTDLKLTQYINSFYPQISSYWIGLRKYVDQYNQEKWMWSSNNSTIYNDVSWWPWKPNHNNTQQLKPSSQFHNLNHCVVKKSNEDGYLTTSCDSKTKNSFVCQTQTIYPIKETDQSQIKLQCGQTSEIQKEIETLELRNKLKEKIGVNSIKNVIVPTLHPTTTKSSLPVFESTVQQTLFNPIVSQEQVHFEQIKEQSTSNNKLITNIASTVSSSNEILIKQQDEYKLNTTVIAGIICSIGLIIVIINLGVLFLCKNNLKKLIKTNKDLPRDDMIQDYFDSFNTLHTNNKSTMRGTLPALSAQQTRTNSTSSSSAGCAIGDDTLESAQLFFNSNNLNREMTMRQTAFKQLQADQQANLLGQLIIQNQLVNQINNSSNQYDKMNHIATVKPILNTNFHQQPNQSQITNDSAGQYAHTYETLDTLELPNRRAIVNMPIGLNGRNFRTVFNNNEHLLLQQSDITNETNLSTSSSSSGTSSTHQFLKSNNIPNNFLIQQQQQQQHMLCLLNNTKTTNCSYDHQTGAIICNSSDIGSWSPDSAYYSSIPTLTNYAPQLCSFPTKQFLVNATFNNTNANNVNDNFKSHLV